MTAYVLVCAVALLASSLTLFSGFGLGTLLLPAFAVVFPVEIAVSATAVVHLLNNVFKLALVGRWLERRTVIAFGLPAALAAFGGAFVLRRLTELPPLGTWTAVGRTFAVTPTGLLVGLLVAAFAVVELRRTTATSGFPPRFIPVGGLLSGLFGGLSGHQGALRSAFLIRAGLTKEQFIGSGVACAVLVDLSRLSVYGPSFFARHFDALGRSDGLALMAAATLAAFAGAFVGTRLIHKITLDGVRRLVGVLLGILGLGMATGVL
jgi:uncharacterized membrane protein YfcA